MDQTPRVENDGIVVFGGFEGASVAAIGHDGGAFVADCLEEPNVPEKAFGHVFYDYSFACGIRNKALEPRGISIRLRLCPRSARRNISFMEGPYWLRQGRSWRHLPPSVHAKGEDWVETELTVPPESECVLSTKPFWTADDTVQILSEYEERLPFVQKRSILKTAEGRDIWAIETEPRSRRVLITSSLQSAEFAGDVMLFLLDWLGTDSRRCRDILKTFQLSLVPETMPDGVARGYSIMNAVGQCPMFDFGKAFEGVECARETQACVALMREKRPLLWIDLHVHPGRYNTSKVNPVKPECYPDAESASRAERIARNLLSLFDEWRLVAVPVADPDFDMRDSGLVLAAQHFGTASFCFQDYAHTEAGKKAAFVSFMDAALRAMP